MWVYLMAPPRPLERPLPFWELDTAPLAFQLMMLSYLEMGIDIGIGEGWIDEHKN